MKRSWQDFGLVSEIEILDSLTNEQTDLVEKHVSSRYDDGYEEGLRDSEAHASKAYARHLALCVAIAATSTIPMASYLGVFGALLAFFGGGVIAVILLFAFEEMTLASKWWLT